MMGVAQGSLPVRYLGVPLISKRLSHTDCLELTDKVSRRISSWRGKLLSYAGRMQLVKSVLASFAVYWLVAFVLPKRTIHEVNWICRVFLWNVPDAVTSNALIGWDEVAYPYEEGGLGLRDILTVNKALIIRHVWNIISDRDSLWVKWVKNNRIKGRDFWGIKIPSSCSWSWRSILKGRKEAALMVRHLIGNGTQTGIWKDPWNEQGILQEFFPVQLHYVTDCVLNVRASSMLESDQWKIPESLKRAAPDIAELLEGTDVHQGDDEIIWAPSTTGKYKLAETFEFMRKKTQPWIWNRVIWFGGEYPDMCL